jgi:hypothetical protein
VKSGTANSMDPGRFPKAIKNVSGSRGIQDLQEECANRSSKKEKGQRKSKFKIGAEAVLINIIHGSGGKKCEVAQIGQNQEVVTFSMVHRGAMSSSLLFFFLFFFLFLELYLIHDKLEQLVIYCRSYWLITNSFIPSTETSYDESR